MTGCQRRVFACGVVAAVLVGCSGASNVPPDVSGGEPVLDRHGEVVGTADPEEITRVLEHGGKAAVYRDGVLVGHFGPEGFVATDRAGK